MLLAGGWLRRQRTTCGRSRLAALRWRLLGVFYTEARSIGRDVQWSPMKPES
jgi:hypothetical protein